MSGSVLDPPRLDPGIDARIRARRIEVRRSEGRRRLRRLLVLLCVTVAVGAAWGLTRSPLLDVDHLAVTGQSHTPVAELVAAADIARGDALVDVDTGAAARRVAALPWVATAEVARSWGGTVTIEVVERVPLAVLRAADGSAWLIDAEGIVLDAATARDPSAPPLPTVEGLAPPAQGAVLDPAPDRLLHLLVVTPPDVWTQVDAIEVDAAGETWIRLRPRAGEVDADGEPRVDGGRIRLGDLRAVDDQVLAVATLLAQVDLTDLDVADLRVPDSFVVTRVVPGTDAEVAAEVAADGGGEE